ncbi:hypothetical protein [Streptomyces qinglanensis]|uniref:Uncharacterized protein n=1 Tax=Streptomyces qinglanensis TaxID=943816 RepID=A0A1H9U341_9ACTN|nr:hypothetical protein [Streptomyces qinglanensis]SES03671.1 hypothetical protein SAMN05421870_107259 [Streptomyces qinglanensis]
MSTRTIEHKAPKKQFLTLDELAAFVQDAMRSGAAGTEVVSAAVSFGGKLQSLAIDVDTAKQDPAETAN